MKSLFKTVVIWYDIACLWTIQSQFETISMEKSLNYLSGKSPVQLVQPIAQPIVQPKKLVWVLAIAVSLCMGSISASGQMVAHDDVFSLQLGEVLEVESPGILDNDLLNDESAPESGAFAVLITDAQHGDLEMFDDGSFSYYPNESFDGFDSFVYASVMGPYSDEATVYFSACTSGPDVFFCWKEAAWLAKAAEYGYFSRTESFEDEAAFESAHYPNMVPVVYNMGIGWSTNHPDMPEGNGVSVSSGPARTGSWAILDPFHGYAQGTPGQCDVDNPPSTCLYNDGFTGTVQAGQPPLVGVGGYVEGTHGASVDIIIDDTMAYPGGFVFGYQFFGVVDRRPAGFTRFSFEEQNGKIGQPFYIFGDDFTFLATEEQVSAVPLEKAQFLFAGAGPNPANGNTTWRFALPAAGSINLAIYDTRGRLIRQLKSGVAEAGDHAVAWNSRDDRGRTVAAGTYFGKLRVDIAGHSSAQVRKIIILH